MASALERIQQAEQRIRQAELQISTAQQQLTVSEEKLNESLEGTDLCQIEVHQAGRKMEALRDLVRMLNKQLLESERHAKLKIQQLEQEIHLLKKKFSTAENNPGSSYYWKPQDH